MIDDNKEKAIRRNEGVFKDFGRAPMLRSGLKSKPKYAPKSAASIRKIARELRMRLSIDHRYSPDLFEILHRLTAVFPKFKLKEIKDDDLPNAEAKAHCEAGILEVPKSILYALNKYGDPRARWTIAHELGHFALEHPGRKFRKRPDEPVKEADELFEMEADTFASEFLVPIHLAKECRSADEIRRLFQVSLDAASRRHAELQHLQREADSQAQEIQSPRHLAPAPPSLAKLPTVTRSAVARPLVFAAMAFTDDTARLYLEILKPTIEGAGLECRRADEIPSASPIADDVQSAIRDSSLVVAEISGFNPNVMHEIGLAQSLGKPTILLCQDSYKENEIPSNIRHIRRIMYRNDAGGGPGLQRRLIETLETIISCWFSRP